MSHSSRGRGVGATLGYGLRGARRLRLTDRPPTFCHAQRESCPNRKNFGKTGK